MKDHYHASNHKIFLIDDITKLENNKIKKLALKNYSINLLEKSILNAVKVGLSIKSV